MKTNKLLGPLISLCIFIICIALVELFLSFFAPVPDPYEKYYPDLNQYIRLENGINYRAVTELEPELPGADGQNVFSTNNMGFRGGPLVSPKPDDEYRIFILGPSNAECFYQDDSESIDAVLQEELRKHSPSGVSVKVYNAALSAAGSDDIISMIVHRIIHLEPDMFIIFSGDLYTPLKNWDYLHYLQKDAPRKKFPLISFLATEFQIPRRIYYLLKKLAPSEQDVFEAVMLKSEYMKVIQQVKSTPVSNIKPKTNIPAFSKNMKTVIGTAKIHDIQLVFVTQQSTWNSTVDPATDNWHWALFFNGIRYTEEAMHEALEIYNDEIRRLASEYAIPVFDLARTIPKSTEYFYDDVHFNVKGAQFAGEHMASFILQEGLIR